ncbi:unnamed protein product [Schistosoma curassoni]|uniref:Fn3_like domain-containing protein n=1 Tax=Schistosoma curassoni TaxID=6186 RepID=A0A183KL85_9TREM|nr:unnamed protein product [Schistosoma curassoni]
MDLFGYVLPSPSDLHGTCLEPAEVTYYRENDLRLTARIVVKNVGKSMVRLLDVSDLNIHNQHVDQIQFQEPVDSVLISVNNFNTNEQILVYAESVSSTQSDRRTMNLRRRRSIDKRISGRGICMKL